jgi:hypothetical protein
VQAKGKNNYKAPLDEVVGAKSKKRKKTCFLDLQRVLLSRLLMQLCLNQKLVTLLFHACMMIL